MNKTIEESKLKLHNSDFSDFCGTANYYRYIGAMFLTDGVKYVVDKFQAYWFVDLIWSYQTHKKIDRNDIQFWKLNAFESEAEAILEKDAGIVLIKQEIGFTDFPNGQLRLWAAYTIVNDQPALVVYLPSEH